MRPRVFVINPPRSRLARMLWLFGVAAGGALLLAFGVVILGVAMAVLAVVWLLRRLRPSRRRAAAPISVEPEVIEGEFTIVPDGRRPPE